MDNKKIIILLTLIILIAGFLRLYNITQLPPGLYPDEAMNGNNALEALSTGDFKVFYPENNGREGLFINIQALFLAIFGNEPWTLRLPSAIFGILTVLGLYFLARELFGKKIALLSAFFLATSFWHINFSRIGFRAIIAPFFLVWGIYFLLLAIRKNSFSVASIAGERLKINERVENLPGTPDEGRQGGKFSSGASLNFDAQRPTGGKKNFFYAIIGGLFYGLGFYSYIAYRATPLLIFIILLFYWLKNKEWLIRKKILLSIFYFLLTTFIVAAPLGLYFLENPQDFFGRTTQVSIFNSPTPLKDLGMNILKTAGMFNFVGDWNWRHNYAGRPELFWLVGILFLLGVFVGLRMFFEKISRRPSGHGSNEWNERESEAESQAVSERLGERDRGFREEYSKAFLILFSWLIIAALPVIISNEGVPHALRSLLMAPAVFILAGLGGIWLIEKLTYNLQLTTDNKKYKLLLVVGCLLLVMLIFEAYTTYFVLWGQNPNVLDAFSNDYVWAAKGLKELPKELPKYVVVENGGVDVRGIPMKAQTIMFITDTFTPEKQKEKNIHYLLPNQINQIPENSYVVILK